MRSIPRLRTVITAGLLLLLANACVVPLPDLKSDKPDPDGYSDMNTDASATLGLARTALKARQAVKPFPKLSLVRLLNAQSRPVADSWYKFIIQVQEGDRVRVVETTLGIDPGPLGYKVVTWEYLH